MNLVAHDPFVSAEAAKRISVELVGARGSHAGGPISSPCIWPRRPRPRVSSTRRCWPGPSRPCGSSTSPGAASSWNRTSPTRCATARSPARRSTSSTPSRAPTRRSSNSTRSWSRRTSERPPSRLRTRRARRSPRWSNWPWPGEFVPFAVNVEAGAASETVRPYQPLAETSGGAAGRAGRRSSIVEHRDQLRGTDRRVRHPDPHPVGPQGVLRRGVRSAGVLRQRSPDGRGARHRRAADHVDHAARLRQPHHPARR